MAAEWLGAAIQGAGSLLGGLFGSSAQAQQNQANRVFASGEADKAYQRNAYQAKVHREWQTHMSNTAYQRATADMKLAGINPMLAYMQGGASAGGGSPASTSQANTPQQFDTGRTQQQAIENMVSSGIEVYKKSKEAKVAGATKDKITAEKKKTDLETQILEITKGSVKAQADLVEAKAKRDKSTLVADKIKENPLSIFEWFTNKLGEDMVKQKKIKDRDEKYIPIKHGSPPLHIKRPKY